MVTFGIEELFHQPTTAVYGGVETYGTVVRYEFSTSEPRGFERRR